MLHDAAASSLVEATISSMKKSGMAQRLPISSSSLWAPREINDADAADGLLVAKSSIALRALA
jgi:hypothetical protein